MQDGYAIVLASTGRIVAAFADEYDAMLYASDDWHAPAGDRLKVLPLVDGHVIQISIPAVA